MATYDASKRVPMGSSPFFPLPSSGARPMLPTSMGMGYQTGATSFSSTGFPGQATAQSTTGSVSNGFGLQPLVPTSQTSSGAGSGQTRPAAPSPAPAPAAAAPASVSGYYPSSASAAPASVEPAVESAAATSSDDTQVMTKLQQLMNQMGTFMKSVDARLTTLEKMTGQLMNNYTEQSKTMDLRFQEITTLIQQKSSVIQLPHPPAAPAPTFATPPPQVPSQIPSQVQATPTMPPQALLSDAEVARQLQEQYDREAHLAAATAQGGYPPLGLPPTQPNLTALQRQQMQMHRPQPPVATSTPLPPPPPPSSAAKEPCPLCGAIVPPADLENHVNQHFDEAEGIVADTLDKKNAKKQPGFWDRLFGNEEPEAAPTQTQPTTPAQPPSRPAYPMYPPPPGSYPATQAMYPYFPGQPHQPAYGFQAR